MSDFNTYLTGFFGIGSKKTVRENRRRFLETSISYVPHTLTTPQKVQARRNIGIDLLYKVGSAVYLTKGTHTITFTQPFTEPYVVIPYGTTGAAAFSPIITNWSNPANFTVKMPVDGWLFWRADLVTEL